MSGSLRIITFTTAGPHDFGPLRGPQWSVDALKYKAFWGTDPPSGCVSWWQRGRLQRRPAPIQRLMAVQCGAGPSTAAGMVSALCHQDTGGTVHWGLASVFWGGTVDVFHLQVQLLLKWELRVVSVLLTGAGPCFIRLGRETFDPSLKLINELGDFSFGDSAAVSISNYSKSVHIMNLWNHHRSFSNENQTERCQLTLGFTDCLLVMPSRSHLRPACFLYFVRIYRELQDVVYVLKGLYWQRLVFKLRTWK